MRHILVLAAAAAAISACQRQEEAAESVAEAPVAAATAEAAARPQRRAGLWEQTITVGEMTQSTRICLDAATDEQLSMFGQQGGDDACRQQAMTRVGDQWRFTSVCDMGSGGTVTTEGAATGDFQTRYEVTARTRTEGADVPQMNGEHEMRMVAAWQGPCPEGMRPGDMTMPGGMTVNVLEMGKMAR